METKVYLKDQNVVIERNNKYFRFIPTRSFSIEPEESFVVLEGQKENLTIRYENLRDEDGNGFATPNDAIDYLSPFVGFKSGGTGGANPSAKMFDYTANNYNELNLINGEETGQLAFVYDSQGTSWLPSSLGGTYYPKGTYVWSGTQWISNRNGIASEFSRLQTGYSFHADDQYTEANPFIVPSGQTLNLPNNNGFSITSQLPNGYNPFYDGSLLWSNNDFDSINLSVRFKVKSSINQGGLAYFLDIAGNQGRIIGDSRRLLRTAGVENPINFESSPFTGATFNSNGGNILIEAVAGTLSIYDISYKITLQHQGK